MADVPANGASESPSRTEILLEELDRKFDLFGEGQISLISKTNAMHLAMMEMSQDIIFIKDINKGLKITTDGLRTDVNELKKDVKGRLDTLEAKPV